MVAPETCLLRSKYTDAKDAVKGIDYEYFVMERIVEELLMKINL